MRFQRRMLLMFAMVAAIAATALGATTPAPRASAQEADYDLQINAWRCVVDGCEDPINIGGAVVEATNEDGSETYGTCETVTDVKPGGCTIDVPAGTTVNVWLDEATAPEGYAPTENPIVYEVPEEQQGVGDVTFTLLPVAPPDDGEPTETATETPTDEPEEPAEGRNVAIFAAPCDTEGRDRGEAMMELNDLVIGEDGSVGSDDAIPAEMSVTEFSVSQEQWLSELDGDEFSVVVFDLDDPDQVVACGMIGGEPLENSLSIGLREVDDSGYSGIASFIATDDDETTFFVYLAEGLSGESR